MTGSTPLGIRPGTIPSPSGAMNVIYGGEADPTLRLSAGFLRRSVVGTVETPARLSWSPDSRRFYVNDPGGAFRLWTVNARAQAVESRTIRDAAIAELERRNGCDSVPEGEVATSGMGWSPDGSHVYVRAAVRCQTGGCLWTGVNDVVVVSDVATGDLVETLERDPARRRWPTLSWGSVTAP